MFQRYGGGNMDEGWTRLMFEQFNVPFKPIMDAEIKAGGLERQVRHHRPAGRFDRGDDRRASAAGGTARGGGGGGGFGGGADNTPAEFRSGFGAEGVKALQAFVQKGGTLLTFARPAICRFSASACRCATSSPGCRRRSSGRPGRRCASRFNNSNPLAYGMPAEGLALFMAGGQVYEVTSTDRSQDVEILTTYVERDILQSGWLLGEQVIAKKAAAVISEARRRQGGADRLPPAASRPDARHVQAGVQRAVERAVALDVNDHGAQQ